jgi:hypothetical protein
MSSPSAGELMEIEIEYWKSKYTDLRSAIEFVLSKGMVTVTDAHDKVALDNLMNLLKEEK